MEALTDSLYSAVGSLTNTHTQANTANSKLGRNTSDHTIKKYLDFLEDAYLFRKAKRYDVKGRKYYGTPLKYYATDIGLTYIGAIPFVMGILVTPTESLNYGTC